MFLAVHNNFCNFFSCHHKFRFWAQRYWSKRLQKIRTLPETYEDLINIIQIALHHFSESYAKIINSNKDRETKIGLLKEIGLKGFIDNSLLSKMDFKEKFSLDISHKKWKFTDMFLFFIGNRKATTIPNKKVKVSKDKMILISRLIYTVGYDGKRYNEEYDSENNKNRMLSNLLRRYKNEKFPSVIANNYIVIS